MTRRARGQLACGFIGEAFNGRNLPKEVRQLVKSRIGQAAEKERAILGLCPECKERDAGPNDTKCTRCTTGDDGFCNMCRTRQRAPKQRICRSCRYHLEKARRSRNDFRI